jgi:hypothetical protein
VTPTPDPVLLTARPGDLVGIEVACPLFNCEWKGIGSAEVVNEYGVKDPLPKCCPTHGLHVNVTRVVEVVG